MSRNCVIMKVRDYFPSAPRHDLRHPVAKPASRMKLFARRRWLVIPVCGASLLALSELVLRVLNFGPGHAPLDPDRLLHHVHPKSYSYFAYSRTGEYGGFRVHYDAGGWRVAAPTKPAAKAPPGCRIAFMGDSFTEAGQVPFEDSFVGLLATLTGCEVTNYGVASYSPIFYDIQWKTFVRQSKPALVVLQLSSDDVLTDAGMLARAVRDASGWPVALPDSADTTVRKFLRRSYLVRVARMLQQKLLWGLEDASRPSEPAGTAPEQNPDVSQLSADLVLSLSRNVHESGAKFVFFAIPAQQRLANPALKPSTPELADKWKAWAQTQGVPYVDVAQAFRGEPEKARSAFLWRDGHYSGIGHLLTARALCQQLKDFFGERGSCADLRQRS